MSHYVIWLDSQEAKIFTFTKKDANENDVKRAVHHHRNSSERKEDEKTFFKTFTAEIQSAEEILLIGPGIAKDHYKHYLEDHNKHILEKIIGTETVDHPTDNQILQLAKKYFKEHHIRIN